MAGETGVTIKIRPKYKRLLRKYAQLLIAGESCAYDAEDPPGIYTIPVKDVHRDLPVFTNIVEEPGVYIETKNGWSRIHTGWLTDIKLDEWDEGC